MKTKLNLIVPRACHNWSRRSFISAILLLGIALLGQSIRASDVVWSGGSGTGAAWVKPTL